MSGHAFSRSTRKQPDQTRVASMPDTAWPIGGHPPGSSRDSRYIPVSMSSLFLSTRHQRFACARLPDPHLTHQVRLFPHRSPRQSSANAAVGGLEPLPAERLRRAYLHLPRSTASRGSTYQAPLGVRDAHLRKQRIRRSPRCSSTTFSAPQRSLTQIGAPDLLQKYWSMSHTELPGRARQASSVAAGPSSTLRPPRSNRRGRQDER